MVLKKQLQDFKEERETLKSTVQRLTSELSRYQAKYRPISDVRYLQNSCDLPVYGSAEIVPARKETLVLKWLNEQSSSLFLD